MTLTGVTAVFEHHLAVYRRAWRASALSSFILPVLGVAGFGLGVGSYIRGDLGGQTYRDYVLPGLLCCATLYIAVGDSTWSVMSGFQWSKTYLAQSATSLHPTEILGGHLAFVVLRAMFSSLTFLLIAALLGTLHTLWALSVPFLMALTALAFAAPTTAYSATVRHESALALVGRLGVTPMTLFTGVFYPIGFLPEHWRWLAYLSPLWHAVDVCRAAMTGAATDWPVLGHLSYLALWSVAGILLASAAFRRRLRG